MSRRRPIAATVAGALTLAAAAIGVAAGERIEGPVAASVVRVIDGDTLKVDATIWLGTRLTVNARIRGIDTPEIRGACPREKTMAEAARMALAAVVARAPLRLIAIENDKYGGRIVADIVTADGADVASLMLATGLARPYDGARRRGWCDVAGVAE